MIRSDLPITSKTEDQLNRKAFANSLAQALLQHSEAHSFAIGLYGAWGSGKTSLLNMVLESVQNADNNVIILRFNPWLCTEPKQLVVQFFKQLATATKLKNFSVWSIIDRYGDLFDSASIIPYAGPFVNLVGKVLKPAAKNQRENRENDLQRQKNKIIEQIEKENFRIIVSIDDIDRLSEDEIVAVFQLVKSLADFPNMVYLLAFDYNVVIHALKKVQNGDGKEYLEKIIQVPFEIPAPNLESIYDMLISRLDEMIQVPENQWDKSTWLDIYHYGLTKYIKTIRDVIRYVNVFSLKYALLKEETNPVDLLGLTCLQVFEPVVYALLPANKDILCGGVNFEYSFKSQQEKEDILKKRMEVIFSDNELIADKSAAKNILGILFPRIKKFTERSYHPGRAYEHRICLIYNSIAAPECFDRYFSLALEDGAIPSAITKHMLYEAEPDEFIEWLKQIEQENKLISFLELLEAYANNNTSGEISTERARLIIQCLTQQWHHFEEPEQHMLMVPFSLRLLFCTDPLLEQMEASSRYACIQSVFEDSLVHSSTLELLLLNLEHQHGRFTDRTDHTEKPLVSLEELQALEKLFLRRATDLISSGEWMNERGDLAFLYLMKQLDPESTASIQRTLVTDDLSLVRVISYCISHGTAVVNNEEQSTWGVKQDSISEFIDINEARERMSAFVKTQQFDSLPQKEKMDIAAFLIEKDSVSQNEAFDNSIYESAVHKKLRDIEAAKSDM